VIDVLLSGTSWNSAVGGVSLANGSDQLDAAAVTNANQIKVVFSEPVSVQTGDLELRGVNVANYLSGGPAGFSYEAASRTATWTLASPIGADKLLLEIDNGAIADLPGLSLDGEWTDSVSTFSGDGLAGGQLQFRFNVLPGDVDGSGQVSSADLRSNLAFQFKGVGQAGYSAAQDLDGNGAINIQDWARIRDRIGGTLPAGNPPTSGSPPASSPAAVVATAHDAAFATLRSAGRASLVTRRAGSSARAAHVAPATTIDATQGPAATKLRASRQSRASLASASAVDQVFEM
jgi:hypothetical protein